METFMSAEIVKKAPVKPKKVATKTIAKAESSVEAAAKPAVKKKAAPKATTVAATVKAVTPTREEIARLAERYWVERGWQDGYAEQDWLRAEQELLGIAS
jgi:Protein of unknown function (DUF2934)